MPFTNTDGQWSFQLFQNSFWLSVARLLQGNESKGGKSPQKAFYCEISQVSSSDMKLLKF